MTIVNDYLKSNYCLDSFSDLVVNQALRNTVTVVPGIQDLLMRYLKTDRFYLEGLFSQMLTDVCWSEPVKGAMYG